jgi:uncharacterized membrane protein
LDARASAANPTVTETPAQQAGAQGFKKDRMSSLQDGIFAVALTLLAVDLRIPDGLSHAAVHGRFVELLPAIAVYAATFAMVAVVWLFVYSFQEIVSKQDIPGTSLLLLACSFVVLLPFTSSTFARYPSERTSVAAFVGNVLSMVLIYTVYVEYASRRLVPKTVDRGLLRTLRYFLWSEVGFGALAILFLSRPVVTLLWLVIAFIGGYIVLLILHQRFLQAALAAEQSPDA